MLHKDSKIIILDDEHAVAEFTSTTLEQLGFMDIEIFTSVKLFVDRIRTSAADLFFFRYQP
jgi:FixJ family two-component response regulator